MNGNIGSSYLESPDRLEEGEILILDELSDFEGWADVSAIFPGKVRMNGTCEQLNRGADGKRINKEIERYKEYAYRHKPY